MNCPWITRPISRDKRFHVRSDITYAEAEVSSERRYVLARVGCAPNCEADLALCLAALVEAGVINVEKLRAALVLAEPVAREAVATAESGP